ncbi:MAG TPA: POTRA domain-containing protein, partial [Stellaceae bacterium]|nr:POTRA domain-containing protein [Stellaceae bacterium]
MRRRSPAWPIGRARSRGWLAWALAAGLILAGIAPALAAVDYRTEIRVQGVESGPVTVALTAASQLVALQSKPPLSNAALRRRAVDDLPRLIQVMHAEGYWSAKASFELDESQKPVRLTVTIDPGPLYTLASVTFHTQEGREPTLLQSVGPTAFGLEVGGAARSAPVAAAESQIVERYARNGYPFAKVTNRNAVVDVAKRTMSVTYTVDPGSPATFGPVTVGGLVKVEREVVERRIGWKRGAPYDSRLVEATRQDLVQTGLFSAVRIDHAGAPDAQGEVAMTIALVEGPPHSIGAGIAYNTTIGFGGQTFWEDRNLFGEGERLRVTAGAAQRQLALALDFRKPDFVDRNQTLIGDAGLLQQTTDAYNSFREQLFAGIERPLAPSLTFVAGPDFEHARVHQNETGLSDENYSL